MAMLETILYQKKVLRANKENLKVFEEKKSSIEAEENKRKEKSEEIAKKIQGLEILIIRNAAENGQLYGSVTSKDIVKEIFLLNKIQFINEQINLKKTLKSIGVFEVEISVYTNLKAKILVSIAKTKELGLEQIKEFKNPKKIKKVKEEKEGKNIKKDENKEKSELDTKDLIQEIEKKEEVSKKKKVTAKSNKVKKKISSKSLKTKESEPKPKKKKTKK